MCIRREQLLTELNPGDHLAHLYVDSQTHCEAIALYAHAALVRNHAVILVAVNPHLEGVFVELRRRGHDPAELYLSGQLICFDASVMLDEIVHGQSLQDELVRARLEPMIQNALSDFGGVAAYGEMVDLLWQRSQRPLAMQLERIWNEFIERFGITLLCGYRANLFDDTVQEGIEEICQTHTHLIPLADLKLLQQAVDQALSELTNSSDIDALRDSLAQQCRS